MFSALFLASNSLARWLPSGEAEPSIYTARISLEGSARMLLRLSAKGGEAFVVFFVGQVDIGFPFTEIELALIAVGYFCLGCSLMGREEE